MKTIVTIYILEKIWIFLNKHIKCIRTCNMYNHKPERLNDEKINLVNISCIFFLLILLYLNINSNISYQYLESSDIQKSFPIYANYSKAGPMMINTSLPENRSALSVNDIKNFVSVGEIDNNVKASNLANQSIYPNKINFSKSITQYIFSANKSEIESPENNSHTLEFEKSRIALVKPTFTDAAYHSSFYNFYRM